MAGLHQTVTLAPGRHRSPSHGVCAMELASLLGGERFSDHPTRVCAVLAAFLRGYNDATSARRRKELYRLASVVVDSRTADPAVRAERAEALVVFAFEAWRTRGLRNVALQLELPGTSGFADVEAAGAYVGRLARRNAALHARTTALVEELAQRGRTPDAPDAPAPPPAELLPT